MICVVLYCVQIRVLQDRENDLVGFVFRALSVLYKAHLQQCMCTLSTHRVIRVTNMKSKVLGLDSHNQLCTIYPYPTRARMC